MSGKLEMPSEGRIVASIPRRRRLRETTETLLAGECAHCVSDEGIRLERYVLLAAAEKSH